MSSPNEGNPSSELGYDPVAYSHLVESWEAVMGDAKKTSTAEMGLPRIDLPSMTITREIPHALGIYIEDNFVTEALVGAFRRFRHHDSGRSGRRVIELPTGQSGSITLIDDFYAPGKKIITSGGRTSRYLDAARLMYAVNVNDTPGSCEFSILALGNDMGHPERVFQRVTPQNKSYGILMPTASQVADMDRDFESQGLIKPSEHPVESLAQLIDGHRNTGTSS